MPRSRLMLIRYPLTWSLTLLKLRMVKILGARSSSSSGRTLHCSKLSHSSLKPSSQAPSYRMRRPKLKRENKKRPRLHKRERRRKKD